MKVYVMDSFSDRIFGGNQAGVVLADKALEPAVMQQVAAELKHSETAFVWQTEEGNRLRYFTPAGEVDLCGHATVAVFALLRRLGRIEDGTHKALTRAGALEIEVSGETVWMDMGSAQNPGYPAGGKLGRAVWSLWLDPGGQTGGPAAGDCKHGSC